MAIQQSFSLYFTTDSWAYQSLTALSRASSHRMPLDICWRSTPLNLCHHKDSLLFHISQKEQGLEGYSQSQIPDQVCEVQEVQNGDLEVHCGSPATAVFHGFHWFDWGISSCSHNSLVQAVAEICLWSNTSSSRPSHWVGISTPDIHKTDHLTCCKPASRRNLYPSLLIRLPLSPYKIIFTRAGSQIQPVPFHSFLVNFQKNQQKLALIIMHLRSVVVHSRKKYFGLSRDGKCSWFPAFRDWEKRNPSVS